MAGYVSDKVDLKSKLEKIKDYLKSNYKTITLSLYYLFSNIQLLKLAIVCALIVALHAAPAPKPFSINVICPVCSLRIGRYDRNWRFNGTSEGHSNKDFSKDIPNIPSVSSIVNKK